MDYGERVLQEILSNLLEFCTAAGCQYPWLIIKIALIWVLILTLLFWLLLSVFFSCVYITP